MSKYAVLLLKQAAVFKRERERERERDRGGCLIAASSNPNQTTYLHLKNNNSLRLKIILQINLMAALYHEIAFSLNNKFDHFS